MSKAKDQKGPYIIAESARSEALKALIVPFDILYSIIAIGKMRNGRDFSTNDQEKTLIVLGAAYGVISFGFCLINALGYFCNARKNDNRLTQCRKIVISLLDFAVVIATNIVYLWGDSRAEVSTDSAEEERDLTKEGLFFLIPAILSFHVWEPLKTLIAIFFKCCGNEDNSEEDSDENFEKESKLDYYKAILYATVMTLSTVPETDATYTTLSNFVRLTRDDCRPRKYNILWVMYGAIIFNIIVKCISVFLKALSKFPNKDNTDWKSNPCLIGWAAYAVVTSVLAIISTGCFFVVDNELPLDCSPHFRLNSEHRRLETKNYNFRLAFLVTSWVLSVTILVMGGVCWGRFLWLYWNRKAPRDKPLLIPPDSKRPLPSDKVISLLSPEPLPENLLQKHFGTTSGDHTPATPGVRTTVSGTDTPNPKNSIPLTPHTPSIQETIPQELDAETSKTSL